MKSWLEIVGGLLIEPRRGARRVIQAKPVGLSVVIYGLACLSTMVGIEIARNIGLAGCEAIFGARFGAALIFGLAVGFALAAILHLSCDLLRGAGSGTALFLAILLASLPWTLYAGIEFLISLVALPAVVHFAVKVVLGLWSLAIGIKCVQEIYRFSFFRALSAVLLPALVISLGFTAILFLMVA